MAPAVKKGEEDDKTPKKRYMYIYVFLIYLLSLHHGSAVAQWLNARPETEGPPVRASPVSLCCGH